MWLQHERMKLWGREDVDWLFPVASIKRLKSCSKVQKLKSVFDNSSAHWRLNLHFGHGKQAGRPNPSARAQLDQGLCSNLTRFAAVQLQRLFHLVHNGPDRLGLPGTLIPPHIKNFKFSKSLHVTQSKSPINSQQTHFRLLATLKASWTLSKKELWTGPSLGPLLKSYVNQSEIRYCIIILLASVRRSCSIWNTVNRLTT